MACRRQEGLCGLDLVQFGWAREAGPARFRRPGWGREVDRHGVPDLLKLRRLL